MMVITLLRDTATSSEVTDASLSLAAARRQRSPRGIVKPAAIQMRSPAGESQCGNNERERSRGGGNDGEKEIGGAVCP